MGGSRVAHFGRRPAGAQMRSGRRFLRPRSRSSHGPSGLEDRSSCVFRRSYGTPIVLCHGENSELPDELAIPGALELAVYAIHNGKECCSPIRSTYASRSISTRLAPNDTIRARFHAARYPVRHAPPWGRCGARITARLSLTCFSSHVKGASANFPRTHSLARRACIGVLQQSLVNQIRIRFFQVELLDPRVAIQDVMSFALELESSGDVGNPCAALVTASSPELGPPQTFSIR